MEKNYAYSFITKIIKEQNYNLLKLIEKTENLEDNELINIFFKINYYSPDFVINNKREDYEKKILLKKIKKLSKDF